MSQPGQISHGMPPRPNETERELARLRKEFERFRATTIKALMRLPATITVGECSTTINAGAAASEPTEIHFTGTFTAVPFVLVSTEATQIDVAANTVTTTGFNFGARKSNGSPVASDTVVTATYIAIRMN